MPIDNSGFSSLLEVFNDEQLSYSDSLKKEVSSSDLPASSKKTLQMISEKVNRMSLDRDLRGIESSRVVDTEILLNMPSDFFDKYFDYIEKVTDETKKGIVDKGKSTLIDEAQKNPGDKKLEEEAYFEIYNISNDKLKNFPELTQVERKIVVYYVISRLIGLSYLDPLWRDQTIDEIICNGPKDIQVEIRGKLFRVPGCTFPDSDDLESLLVRLYSNVGKRFSRIEPISKARLYDKSRLHATYTSVSPDGPNVNIRRHKKGYWDVNAIMEKGTASPEVMHFIGNLINKGASFCVISGTGGGKTTMLNALSGFYPDDHRIITIEDSLEMKPNPRKMLAKPMECQIAGHDSKAMNIDMRALVKACTQMMPNVIIQGESTDSSAYDLCQALNTGHYGASTIHANTSQLAVTRICSLVAQSGLTTITGAQELVAAAFDFIINIRKLPDGSRKIVSVDEVGTRSVEVDGQIILPVRQLWRFKQSGVLDGRIQGYWEQVGELSQERREAKLLDLVSDKTWEELLELSALPEGVEKAQ